MFNLRLGSLRLRGVLFAVIFLLASAHAGYRIAAHNGWIIVTFGERSVNTGQEPIAMDADTELSLFVLGDTGESTTNRQSVVAAMKRLVGKAMVDEAILLGDNFYENGVTSVNDARFQTDFENAFKSTDFDFPFLVCLGNHDHFGNVGAQVEYTAVSQRWTMPRRYFRVTRQIGQQSADIFVLDTAPIDERRVTAGAQLEWLDRELRESSAKWKIVVGHHPVLTGGRHEVSESVATAIGPLLTRHGVDLYLSGHDHDLQLNDSHQGWLQIVSGAGSKLRSTH